MNKGNQDKKNARLALNIGAIAIGMVMMAYASVPLYSLFCKVTGFGGTTQTAIAAPTNILDREMTVRFNSDTAPSLGWTFEPMQKEVRVKIGEQKLIFFTAENKSKNSVVGTSVYNVTPVKAGSYFNKIQCFCFTEQTLDPGEKATFPVSFFIDPDIAEDRHMNDIKTITLSYTFFKAKS
jgi:cytochrome c oxidase assembly protein subunit 11